MPASYNVTFLKNVCFVVVLLVRMVQHHQCMHDIHFTHSNAVSEYLYGFQTVQPYSMFLLQIIQSFCLIKGKSETFKIKYSIFQLSNLTPSKTNCACLFDV